MNNLSPYQNQQVEEAKLHIEKAQRILNNITFANPELQYKKGAIASLTNAHVSIQLIKGEI